MIPKYLLINEELGILLEDFEQIANAFLRALTSAALAFVQQIIF